MEYWKYDRHLYDSFLCVSVCVELPNVDNVSKEYTLKNDDVWDANLETNYNECDNEVIQIGKSDVEDVNELSFNAKELTALKTVLQDKHILFWLAMCFLLTYSRILVPLVLPIKGKEYLNWKPPDIAKLYLIALALGSIPTMILISILTKYVNDFFLYLCSLIVLLLSLLSIGFLSILKLHTHTTDTTEIILYCSIILKQISSGIFHVLTLKRAINNGRF